MKLRILSGGVLLAFVVIAAGCGSSGGGGAGSQNAALAKLPGAHVFKTAGCSGCHTLKAANAKGQVGPNLDELKPDEVTVASQVRTGGNGMPAFGDRLSSTQIDQVASYVSKAAKSSGQVLGFKPDNTTIASCEKTNKQFCFRQAFGNLAYKEGPEKALAELAKDDKSISGVHADCHQITHWVGRAGLVYYDNHAGVALSHGAMTCNSGYYHGVMQMAFSGLPKPAVIAKAKKLCSVPAVNTSDFLLYQCVHGLGHGLMIYSTDDLPWSLKACHKLPNQFDQISCTGGVFMQNLDTTMGVSKYLKTSNPIYPCNIVTEQDKYYCYLQVTSRILTVDGFNWSKTAGLVPQGREGVGRDLLRVLRPRRLRLDRVPPGRHRPDLQAGRQERQRLHLRRSPRLRKQLRRRQGLRHGLRSQPRRLEGPLLRGNRDDRRRAAPVDRGSHRGLQGSRAEEVRARLPQGRRSPLEPGPRL